MSYRTVDVLGVECEMDVPDDATVVRAIVVVSYEKINSDGNAVEGSHWSSSHMGSDARVGMIHRAHQAITRDANEWE